MTTYAYKVRDATGRFNEGKIDSQSEREAVMALKERGYYITSITEDRVISVKKELSFLSTAKSKNVGLRDLALFCRGLSTMLEAGVPLLSALQSMASQSSNPGLTLVIQNMAEKIERGYSFSQSLNEHPKVFNRVFQGMIQSGEAGGNLDWALGRLADYLEWEKDLRDKVQSATYYPMILIIAMVAASFFMVYFVFPQFLLLFESFNIELPFITKLLMEVIKFMNAFWYLVYGGLILAVIGFYMYVTSEKGKKWWDQKKHHLPLFGELFRKLVVSRFCWIMNGLLKSGMPMVQALETVSTAVGDYYVRDIILEIADKIRRGRNLSQSVREYDFFPPIVTQMVSVGEEAGNLELTLGKLTELYDKEIGVFVGRISTVIEPVLTVIIGAGILILA
ncbi:MAG: type II secretion system F family protein, partial [Atribacterota bacterium]